MARTAIMMILNLSFAMRVQMKMLACGNHDNFTRNLQVPLNAVSVSYTHLDVYKRQISSFDDAEKFISLGAERLGTSRLIKILKNTDTGAGY